MSRDDEIQIPIDPSTCPEGQEPPPSFNAPIEIVAPRPTRAVTSALVIDNYDLAAKLYSATLAARDNMTISRVGVTSLAEMIAEAQADFVDEFGELIQASFAVQKLVDLSYDVSESRGWHLADPRDLEVAQFQANTARELSELWEAWREGREKKPCDKADKMIALGLPVLTAEEEELADVVIRVFDYAKKCGIDMGRAILVKSLVNAGRPLRHGGKLA